MRYLILSDLHANLEATRAVLADAGRRGYDAAVCLGDIVGYGASPNEVIDLLRTIEPLHIVRGNHDKAAWGITGGEGFHQVAREAALWTRERLSADNAEFLRGLPEGPRDIGPFWISHGSPLDEETYILQAEEALDAFKGRDFRLAFFGHTHFACLFDLGREEIRASMLPAGGEAVKLEADHRYLINPGSIGQPRDCDPNAAYAILDDEKRALEPIRVPYDVAAARDRILRAGLPPVLAYRLAEGV